MELDLRLFFPIIFFCVAPLWGSPSRLSRNLETEANPCSWYRFGYGVLGSFIQNDMLDVRRNHAEVHKSGLNSVLGELTLDLFNSFNFFAGVGTSKMVALTNLSTLYESGPFRNNMIELDFTTAITWSIGGSYQLFDWQNWYGGLGLMYFAYYPKLNFLEDQHDGVPRYVNLNASYSTWMLSLGGGYQARISSTFSLKPHMAATYGPSYMDIEQQQITLNGGTTVLISDLYSPYMWGYLIGATLVGGDSFQLSVELGRVMYMGYSILLNLPF